MGERNRYGLGRTIPESKKLEVRRRCGFGCVRCGLGFYDYEHFNPDFKDAKEHNVEGITLLCMQCNQKRARGLLAAETVALANANPRCRQEGFTREEWGFGHEPIEVVFAGHTFINVRTMIAVNGKPKLAVRPPEEGSAFYRLSGLFSDSTGQATLKIQDNEWSAGADNWDVKCVKNRITVRSGPKDVSLVIRSDPPHKITIEELHMHFDGYTFHGNEEELRFSSDGVNWNRTAKGKLIGCNVGLAFSHYGQ